MNNLNLSNIDLIVEILEKVDPTIIQRFKEISNQIREYQKETNNIISKNKVLIENLNTKIDVLVAEQEKIIGRVFFNK